MPASLSARRAGTSILHPSHGTNVCLGLASGYHCQVSSSWVAAPPLALVCDATARVAPICCLGRIVPGTTVEWASSEIAPRGSVRPLDTTLDAPRRAPRQLDKRWPDRPLVPRRGRTF